MSCQPRCRHSCSSTNSWFSSDWSSVETRAYKATRELIDRLLFKTFLTRLDFDYKALGMVLIALPKVVISERSPSLVYSSCLARSCKLVSSAPLARSSSLVYFHPLARSPSMVYSSPMARSLLLVYSILMARSLVVDYSAIVARSLVLVYFLLMALSIISQGSMKLLCPNLSIA